ncbi:MAG: CHAT domain-containing protein [Aphanocapsa sp. GSE-SYN-MK-11-07L]|jgi:CHAT domain-containing protein/Tfp pilus assembly protein PilF|nr:CHAT domain-containing protein [Aphanocapsa sp. GSE-SYN-MK-11-07L]
MHPRLICLRLTFIGVLLSLAFPLGLAPHPLGTSVALSQTTTPSDRKAEAERLINASIKDFQQQQFSTALEKLQAARILYQQLDDKSGEAIALLGTGAVYSALGEQQKALAYYNQALPLRKAVGDRSGEANTLSNIGVVYADLGEKQKALEYYNQALPILQAVSDRSGEATTLDNIGRVYNALGEKQKALEYYNQALPLRKAVGDRSGEATTLHNIGRVYSALGEKQKALDYYYNQALPLRKTVGDRGGEALTLGNIASVLSDQKQPALAIVFYKQSVNITESLRNDIKELPKETQQIYTQTIAYSYRKLSQLLLQQGRIMEAMQVLDLLKVQELQDFFKDVKGNELTAKGLELLPEEQQILAQLNSPTIPDLNIYLKSSNVNNAVQQLQQTAAAQNLKLATYSDLQTRLQTLGTRTALFYPLLLPDRLELVLFTPNSPPIHHSVPVSEKDLKQAITRFRLALQDRYDSQVTTLAQQLYTWLLKPLEAELKQANIQTIIYAPDGQLRYVPLAALHDGQQWAIEKYQINYVTAFSLTSLKPESAQLPRILAGAYTDAGLTTVKVNQQPLQFGPIPAAISEVQNLSKRFPETTVLLGNAFNRQAIAPARMNNYSIIHLATHGKLVDGSPEDSFILLNNAEYITLREIKNWQLPNVGLVILSACQTALGEQLGSGIEVIGLGYQLQVAQARAAIASLWEVDDGGTQVLIDAFYGALKQGQVSKTAALQQAQISLITGKGLTEGKGDPRAEFVVKSKPGAKHRGMASLSHPYYWAPFILIGNGL